MLTENFMPDADPAERLHMLREQAESTEDGKYYRPLSDEELDEKRELLADNSIRLSELGDELKTTTSIIKSKMTPLKKGNETLLTEIKTRQEQCDGTLYNMHDHASRMVITYNEKGEFIKSRRMRPDERQTRMFTPVVKTGS
jgi:hypothetical protein